MGRIVQVLGITKKTQEMPGKGGRCHGKLPITTKPYRFGTFALLSGNLSTSIFCLRSSSKPSSK